MGKKVFISYKYADSKVERLPNLYWLENPKARNYVDELQKKLTNIEHINLGEKDGESLAEFADSTIETSLKNKIFQSSVTIVLISKGMKETAIAEEDQWIPWEISYSLREVTRNDRTCRMNAILGVVLPDETGSYSWYYTENIACNCITHQTGQLFKILKDNMFNMKAPVERTCAGLTIHHGEFSFIKTVQWNTFISTPDYYINKALEILDNKDEYNIKVNIK